MSRIRITPLADQDLVEIWYFIAQDDPVVADRLLDLLEEKYKLLAENPHMGPARPDIAKELRYHPVGNYLLLYRVIPNGIELVRVVHGARDCLDISILEWCKLFADRMSRVAKRTGARAALDIVPNRKAAASKTGCAIPTIGEFVSKSCPNRVRGHKTRASSGGGPFGIKTL